MIDTGEGAVSSPDLSDTDSMDAVNPVRQSAPPVPFEGEYADDIELMKQMGLPLGFLRSPHDLEEVTSHNFSNITRAKNVDHIVLHVFANFLGL